MGKVLVTQAQGPEFDHCGNALKSQEQWHEPVTPALVRQRQRGPWNSLASEPT